MDKRGPKKARKSAASTLRVLAFWGLYVNRNCQMEGENR